MKKAINLFYLSLFFTSLIYAQQDYYWFDNQKIYLTEIENKKFVVVDNSITNSTEIQNLFNPHYSCD